MNSASCRVTAAFRPLSTSDPTARAAIIGDIALTVDRILREFSERQAQILVLRVIGRLTYQQIGDQFGYPHNWLTITSSRSMNDSVHASTVVPNRPERPTPEARPRARASRYTGGAS